LLYAVTNGDSKAASARPEATVHTHNTAAFTHIVQPQALSIATDVKL
jgi:hypothetical protein